MKISENNSNLVWGKTSICLGEKITKLIKRKTQINGNYDCNYAFLAKSQEKIKLLKKKIAPSPQIALLRPPFTSVYNNLNEGFR